MGSRGGIGIRAILTEGREVVTSRGEGGSLSRLSSKKGGENDDSGTGIVY